jgi:hypothetical protein
MTFVAPMGFMAFMGVPLPAALEVVSAFFAPSKSSISMRLATFLSTTGLGGSED